MGTIMELTTSVIGSSLAEAIPRTRLVAATALIDLNEFGHAVIMSVAFALIGIVVFALAFLIITKITPFSIRKEIEEDQNTSLGIVIGSVLIGLSIIIASAIKG
jgi:putative membrane protein